MASRKALITQRDVTRILKGAKAAGETLSIVVKGDEVHFLQPGNVEPKASALAEFRVSFDRRRAAEALAKVK